jgi:anti-sigma regulatory factor (Ser/Thr protein kinase)
LLNDILDLSKIEAGKMEISYQPVNIPQIIIEIYKLFTVHTDAKNIKFSYRIQNNFPEYIIFSEIRFRQILFNTIGNAVKFTDEGEILLELNFEESKEENKINFYFRINDTGIGIEKDKLDNIFRPFIQLDDIKQQQGTGLGLTITKRLVESMGGEIQVKSDLGVGTSFTIRFFNVEKAIDKIASGLNDQVLLTNVKSNLKILLFSGKKDDYSKQIALLKEITNSIKVVEDDLPKAKSLISEVDLIILCGAKNEHVQNAYRVLNQTLSSEKRWFIIITNDDSFRKTKRHPKHFAIKPDTQNLKIVLDEITNEHNNAVESEKLSSCLESLKNNTDFLTYFKDHIYPAFTLAWNTKLMGNIKSFSSELKTSAKKYNMDPVRDFAENLDRNIQNFDINEVERLLQFFKNYCLKNLI